MTNYYTYDENTKTLTQAKRLLVRDGVTIILGNADDFARYLNAYPLGQSQQNEVPAGKVAIADGYKLVSGAWTRKIRYEDAPAPTLTDFDAAMEEHLRLEREARGYTTREPDSYLTSSNERWAQDARDWVEHRDEVMEYALGLINEVSAGGRQPPTMEEFKQGLPTITWSFGD